MATPVDKKLDTNKILNRTFKSLLARIKDSDNTEKMSDILDKNPKILQMYDINGNTALHYACKQKRLNFVKLLIKKAKDNGYSIINAENNDGRTPLYISVQNFNKEYQHIDTSIVNELLKHGANTDIQSKTGDQMHSDGIYTPYTLAAHILNISHNFYKGSGPSIYASAMYNAIKTAHQAQKRKMAPKPS